MQDPDHDPDDQPFFEWTVTRTNNGAIIDHFKVVADIEDDFFMVYDPPHGGLISYKGWTCESIDLSNFIGENVCIEFVTADCALGDHFGYAYIDALCSDEVDAQPVISISATEIYCKGQPFEISVIGSGFNQAQWTISKLDAQGNPYNVVILPSTISYGGSFIDLVEAYEANSNYSIDCSDNLRLNITVWNDCSDPVSSSVDVQLSCAEYEIHYCNIIHNCGISNQVRIVGVNNCDNCTIEWSPQQFLILDDPKFPLINGEDNVNAINQTYHWKVTTPEGCIYEDDINVSNYDYIVSWNKTVGACEYDVNIHLMFEESIDNSQISLILTNRIGNETVSTVLAGNSTGTDKYYTATINREEYSDLELNVHVDFGTCANSQGLCSKKVIIGDESASPFFQPWRAWWPNIFSPLSSPGVLDLWFPYFVSPQSSTCEGWDIFYSGVYYADLEVFDSWGGLGYKITAEADPNGPGLTGAEVFWDGTLSGQLAAADVYVAVLTVRSCFYEGLENVCENACHWNTPVKICPGPGQTEIIRAIDIVVCPPETCPD